ncbi:MAG: helix-turn-helix domain-containing protein [Gammaproteobacteria bacterium]
MSITMTKSSGNVFEDLKVPSPDQSLIKAELAYQINQLIQMKHLTQENAAKILGIDQPKISALRHGRLAGFSVERLFKFLILLDQDVEIIIKPHKKRKKTNFLASHLYVHYAEA